MELGSLLSLVRKRWLSLVVVTVLGLTVGLVASFVATPVFTASAQVFVSVRSSESTSELLQGSDFTVRQVLSYAQLVDSPRVLEPVIRDLGLDESAERLGERVRAESPLDTVLITVTVDDESAQQAAAIANAVAASLAEVVAELETPVGTGQSPVRVSTVRAALPPSSPSSPNTPVNLALGLLAGLVLGFGLAVLRELLDTRVRDAADVEDVVGASVLGMIPLEPAGVHAGLVMQDAPHSLRSEAFRHLRTNLQFLDFERHHQAVVMTSALAGEGKTTTAINLAVSLAHAGQRVALVDADLRRPAIGRTTGLEDSVGLTTVLIGQASLDDVAQPWGDGTLDVITSGRVPPNPSELLGSDTMAALLDELSAKYDAVLIDTPPLLPVTDAAILARRVGGAVVVVGAGTVHRHHLASALKALDAVSARVFGVVVNRAPSKDTFGYTYTYDHLATHRGAVRRLRRPRRPLVGTSPSGPHV